MKFTKNYQFKALVENKHLYIVYISYLKWPKKCSFSTPYRKYTLCVQLLYKLNVLLHVFLLFSGLKYIKYVIEIGYLISKKNIKKNQKLFHINLRKKKKFKKNCRVLKVCILYIRRKYTLSVRAKCLKNIRQFEH